MGYEAHKVFVEHPIQDRSDDEMRVIAEGAFAEVIGMLVAESA